MSKVSVYLLKNKYWKKKKKSINNLAYATYILEVWINENYSV